MRCFTCCCVGLANPKVIDGENGRFHVVVWGFCDLRMLMLCSRLLGERSSLISFSSLIAPIKWEGGQKMLWKFFCKHVQLYLITSLLSTELGPSIFCTFLHFIRLISSMQRPRDTPTYTFSLSNFHYKLFRYKLELCCCFLFMFTVFFTTALIKPCYFENIKS
jgi:hypothetical protein